MRNVDIGLLHHSDARWLETEFNARWPWPRPDGFIAATIGSCPHFVARDSSGRYLGHCHVRSSLHPPFINQGVREIADLSVMPDVRRHGAASALLDAAEALVAQTERKVGIGVGLDESYGPAQRLYVKRGYVPDATGAWFGPTQVRSGATVTAGDDLVVYLSKPLP